MLLLPQNSPVLLVSNIVDVWLKELDVKIFAEAGSFPSRGLNFRIIPFPSLKARHFYKLEGDLILLVASWKDVSGCLWPEQTSCCCFTI